MAQQTLISILIVSSILLIAGTVISLAIRKMNRQQLQQKSREELVELAENVGEPVKTDQE